MNPEHFELAVKTSSGEVKKFPLSSGNYTIGRSPSCEVYVPESSISRKHACITIDGGRATIDDLNSLNGTFVGSDRLEGTLDASETRIVGNWFNLATQQQMWSWDVEL